MASVDVLSETACDHGEGPFFCPERNTLYWFDITGHRRHARDMATGVETFQRMPEMASAMARVDERRDVIFTETGLWLHERRTGCWSPLCEIEADNPVTRCNDARSHASGAFWLGTMGRKAEPGAGSIWHYRKGRLTRLHADVTIPNSICFSPDGRTACFTDTVEAVIRAVAVDPDTGLPDGESRILVDHRGGQGGLDGSVCDGDGNIWNARWGAAALDCYTPDGKRLLTIPMPVRQPSCPAFLPDGRIAVTSSPQGMTPDERAADPMAGFTFAVTPPFPVKPRFDPPVLI